MAMTSPDGIYYPTNSDTFDYFNQWDAFANSTQTALNNQTTGSGTTTEMNAALSSSKPGRLWFNTSNNTLYRATGTPLAWIRLTNTVQVSSPVDLSVTPNVTSGTAQWYRQGKFCLIRGTFVPNSNQGGSRVLVNSQVPTWAVPGAADYQSGTAVILNSTGLNALYFDVQIYSPAGSKAVYFHLIVPEGGPVGTPGTVYFSMGYFNDGSAT